MNCAKWVFTSAMVLSISGLVHSFPPSFRNIFRRPLGYRTTLTNNPEQFMSSPDIIRNRGYPVEIHYVTTSDGYILELHRIPYGKNASSSAATGRPVFLQHGLLDSSSAWLLSPTTSGLAYLLADKGYDVWMGNVRGNTYSRNHTTLKPDQQAFWSFAVDQIGKYDIPACIDYVLNKTGREKLVYIGHSMGTTVFWISTITYPKLNDKIEVMIGLGPVASSANLRSPVRYFSPYVDKILFYLHLKQTRVFLPQDGNTRKIQDVLCSPTSYAHLRFCRNAIMQLTGSDPGNLKTSMVPLIDGHNPAGTSIYTVAQFAQGQNAGAVFRHYNWGNERNLQLYNQTNPPDYDLSQVKAPVYLFWGQNDLLAVPEDVQWLAERLGNLKASFRVEWDKFNHLDFLWATRVKKLLYDRMFTFIPSP